MRSPSTDVLPNNWYNFVHQHSAIGFVTPAARHDGNDIEMLELRRALYEKARARHPERWAGPTRQWKRPDTVTLNPETRKASNTCD